VQRQYAKAEPLYERSLAIREKALGPEHPTVAKSLNNLAALYDSQGQYGKAEPLYQRSLGVSEKALGPEHPDVATSLNNLAELYYVQGQYAKAEPLFQRSLAIREKAPGPEHPTVANSLNNLALLYHAQGQYAKAEPLYQRSLAIREKALGPEHPDVANSLNNLAALYYVQGQYAKAEPLYQRSLAIREKALGRGDLIGSGGITLPYDAVGSYRRPLNNQVIPADGIVQVQADLLLETNQAPTPGEFFSLTIAARSGNGETYGEIGLSSQGIVEGFPFNSVGGGPPAVKGPIVANQWYHRHGPRLREPNNRTTWMTSSWVRFLRRARRMS
jgi:tetratricopeptide (TPR) repeat protein